MQKLTYDLGLEGWEGSGGENSKGRNQGPELGTHVGNKGKG